MSKKKNVEGAEDDWEHCEEAVCVKGSFSPFN